MTLKRTSIIPLDDATLAESFFKSCIKKVITIVKIVMELIAKGDNLVQFSYAGLQQSLFKSQSHDTQFLTF